MSLTTITQTTLEKPKQLEKPRKFSRTMSIEKINHYICSQNYYLVHAFLYWLKTSETILITRTKVFLGQANLLLLNKIAKTLRRNLKKVFITGYIFRRVIVNILIGSKDIDDNMISKNEEYSNTPFREVAMMGRELLTKKREEEEYNKENLEDNTKEQVVLNQEYLVMKPKEPVLAGKLNQEILTSKPNQQILTSNSNQHISASEPNQQISPNQQILSSEQNQQEISNKSRQDTYKYKLENIIETESARVLNAIVVGAFTGIFAQLFVILYFLGTFSCPIGLLFLVGCLCVISHLHWQVLMHYAKPKLERKSRKDNGKRSEVIIKPKKILGTKTISSLNLF